MMNLSLVHNPKSANINAFNVKMNYYICSSGGCGSTILSQYLSIFGNRLLETAGSIKLSFYYIQGFTEIHLC